VALPVHPWQFEHVLQAQLGDAFARGDCQRLDFTDGDFFATSSLRSMTPCFNSADYLKLPMAIYSLGASRYLPPVKMINGGPSEAFLRQALAKDETLQETLRLRRFGDAVLLEVNEDMPDEIRRMLLTLLKLDESDCFKLSGLLGMDGLFQLAGLDRGALKFKPHIPHLAEPISTAKGLFDSIVKGDVLVHHPFDSFRSVESFVASAAADPLVIGIKQTLYRVGTHSPIVESLLAAAEAGKQVAAMVDRMLTPEPVRSPIHG